MPSSVASGYLTASEPGRNCPRRCARYTRRVLSRLLALVRRAPVLAGCLVLGAAFGILWMRGRPGPLAKALAELTPEQQRVIYLRFIADLDSHEIALVMGKRADEVRLLQLHASGTCVDFWTRIEAKPSQVCSC